MSRLIDREKALALRKEGKSYSQIKTLLNISKSTLSYWLRDFPLPKEQIRLLRDVNEVRIERFRETMRKKRIFHLENVLKICAKRVLPLSNRELLLCGLFLYLGEGSKADRCKITITNTDPSIIKFALFWFTKILKIPRDKIKIYVHLYSDMDIREELNFWKKELNLPTKQFDKPYIKTASAERINHKGAFGHGTCAVSYYNVRIKDEILMSIKAIMNLYAKSMRL
jgi:hypothetical protein